MQCMIIHRAWRLVSKLAIIVPVCPTVSWQRTRNNHGAFLLHHSLHRLSYSSWPAWCSRKPLFREAERVRNMHDQSENMKTCFKSVLFVCLFGFLTSSSTTRLYRGRAPRQERLTILRAATHETELGDHDFCLSRSHYTDTDPTCRERAAKAGIEPGTSSPGVARSTAELPRPF